jgi:hypothetical protein
MQYIIKAGGNEYPAHQRNNGHQCNIYHPLNYPQAQDVEDPNEARFVSLADMKHWEMAPTNAGHLKKRAFLFV